MGILIDLAKTSTGILRDAFAKGAPSAERTFFKAAQAVDTALRDSADRHKMTLPAESRDTLQAHHEIYATLHNALWEGLSARGWQLAGEFPPARGTKEQILFSSLLDVMGWAQDGEFNFRYNLADERHKQPPSKALAYIQKHAADLHAIADVLRYLNTSDLKQDQFLTSVRQRMLDQPGF